MLPPAPLPHPPLAMDQLVLRRMRGADLDGVMAIENVSFGRHHWTEDSFLNEMNNQMGRYYVLAGPGDRAPVLGYCGTWLILDEGHITTIATHPQLRGQALGELMVAHVLEAMRLQSARWVTLEVRASNFTAQNLYYKYGFESQGIRPRYYQDNQEDALIMTTPDIQEEAHRALVAANVERLRHRLGQLPQHWGHL